jgi:hypothetical protein
MALTINNFVGFETGDGAEILAGSSFVLGTNPRTGTYSAGVTANSSIQIDCFGIKADAGSNYIAGYAYETPSVLEPSSLWRIFRGWDGSAELFSVRKTSDHKLAIYDVGGVVRATSTNTFSTSTEYFIEIYFSIHDTTGSVDVIVDGTSWVSVGSIDTATGTALASVYINGCGDTVSYRTYIDDFYFMSGATAASDRLGDCEVYGHVADETTAVFDYGGSVGDRTVDSGTIDNSATIPFSDAASFIRSTASLLDGHDGIALDVGITEDPIALKGIWRMKRDGGGGTAHYGLIGVANGTVNQSADFAPTTAYVNYIDIFETNVPTAAQTLGLGARDDAGGQNYDCSGMIGMVLHVPTGTTTYTKTTSLGAVIKKQNNLKTTSAAAAIQKQGLLKTTSFATAISVNVLKTLSIAAVLKKNNIPVTTDVAAVIKKLDETVQTAIAVAIEKQGLTKTASLAAAIAAIESVSANIAAVIQKEETLSTALATVIKKLGETVATNFASALKKTDIPKTTDFAVALEKQNILKTANLAAAIKKIETVDTNIAAVVQKLETLTASLAVGIKKNNVTKETAFAAYVYIAGLTYVETDFAAVIKKLGILKTANVAAVIQNQGLLKTANIAAAIQKEVEVVTNFAAVIKKLETVTFDINAAILKTEVSTTSFATYILAVLFVATDFAVAIQKQLALNVAVAVAIAERNTVGFSFAGHLQYSDGHWREEGGGDNSWAEEGVVNDNWTEESGVDSSWT